jgi:hypothetical protein
MKFSNLPLQPAPRVLRQFAVAWLVLFCILAWRAFVHGHHPLTGVFGAVALMGFPGWFKPAAIRWLFVGATVVAFPIGWLITQLMLAVMFYLVLTPLAWLFRWRGRDELRLRHKPDQAGFWIERGKPPAVENYLKQF